MATVDDFKAKLIGGGARANLFKATLTFPGFAGGDSELAQFMCKAAQLPGSTVGQIDVPYRGRQLKIAGDRTYENWSVTIINDTGFEVRDAMERWQNGINTHVSNSGLTNPSDYQTDLSVDQLDKAGNVIKTYTFRSAWPVSVSSIEVGNDSADTIEEFTVEFAYQYWESNTTS
jgi:hypothetical protein|tara:strand:- start:6413 stop:6934 length:522 start_codon:yes stop_codon:yes gene_type:complete